MGTNNKCPAWFGSMLFAAVFIMFLAFLYKITA